MIAVKAFSLVLENTGTEPLPSASFAFVLPFSIEPEAARPAGEAANAYARPAAAPVTLVAGKEDCLAQCQAKASCASWTYTQATQACVLSDDVPFNRYVVIPLPLCKWWQQS